MDKLARREHLLSKSDQGLIRVAEEGASHETDQLIDLIDRLLEKLNPKHDDDDKYDGRWS